MDDLQAHHRWDLSQLPRYADIEQYITSLQASTTVTSLWVDFRDYEPTPENNRRFIEPLCRCLANLRRYNPNHPLRKLTLSGGDRLRRCGTSKVEGKPFLVAAKKFGIFDLEIIGADLPIQSFLEFCRDNSNLKVLEIARTLFIDEEIDEEEPTISGSLQDSPAILDLNTLTMRQASFDDSTVATTFLNFIAHVTYMELGLGEVVVYGGRIASEQEKKIFAAVIKPEVEEITLLDEHQDSLMEVLEACATVTHITPYEHDNAFTQEILLAIAARNCALARFVDDPRAYPGYKLPTLVRQLAKSPTGLYMLARSFPGIPSFFQTSIDSSIARPNKRKERY